jgi:hypothetical protein
MKCIVRAGRARVYLTRRYRESEAEKSKVLGFLSFETLGVTLQSTPAYDVPGWMSDAPEMILA